MRPSESEDVYGVQKSVLLFTNDLCKIFAENIKGNYFCSTLSAHIALAMAACGADQNAVTQLHKVLHISYSDFELLRDYRRVINILKTDENIEKDNIVLNEALDEIKEREDISEEERDQLIERRRAWSEEERLRKRRLECTTTLANKIYICNDRRTKVNQKYTSEITESFRSEISTLDFLNRYEAAHIINNWCIEVTNEKISDIIDADELPDGSGLILVSAIHFTGTWVYQFLDARPKTFHLNMFKKIQVPTMYLRKYLPYRYLGELNAHAVRLDFKRSEKYMEIIVPNRINGLRIIKKVLYKISNEQFRPIDVSLWLPKFEIQSKIKLEDHLKKLGHLFDKNSTNFNEICDNELFIKTAVQKTYIKVDEQGCETQVAKAPPDTTPMEWFTRTKPQHVTIKANKPFLFRIMDSRLNVPIFIGTVVNPSYNNPY